MLMFFFYWLSCFLLFLFPPAEQNPFRKKNLSQGYPLSVEALFSFFIIILNNCHFTNGIICLGLIEQCCSHGSANRHIWDKPFSLPPRPPPGEFTMESRRCILSGSAGFILGSPTLEGVPLRLAGTPSRPDATPLSLLTWGRRKEHGRGSHLD